MRLPAVHWSLAVLYAGASVACICAVAFPTSAGMAVMPKLVAAMLGLVGAVAIVGFGRRLSRVHLLIGASLATVLTTGLVTEADTRYGASVAAYGYLWVSVYTALFFSVRAVLVQTTLIACGMATALLTAGQTHMALAWAMVTVTALIFGTLLQRLSSQLRDQARTDKLTGALNRRGLAGLAGRVFALADRTQQPVCVAMIDLDRFKQVNDDLGHDAGDRLLALVAASLDERLRTSDVLARTGGDEFLILLPATEPLEAKQLLARLASHSAAHWSAGLCQRQEGENLDVCLSRAAASLRDAKRASRSSDDRPNSIDTGSALTGSPAPA